jgi:hypothetical protein
MEAVEDDLVLLAGKVTSKQTPVTWRFGMASSEDRLRHVEKILGRRDFSSHGTGLGMMYFVKWKERR